MSKKQNTSIPLTINEQSDLIRKIVSEVIKENKEGVKWQALDELQNHAYGYLWPNPSAARHIDCSIYDFNTEIENFDIKLRILFRELEDNILECLGDDGIKNYITEAVRILRNIRKHVNQFFIAGVLASNDYNKKLQQIEAEGVTEDPESGLTPADSISETKLEFPVEALALYLNKICLWAEYVIKNKLSTYEASTYLTSGIIEAKNDSRTVHDFCYNTHDHTMNMKIPVRLQTILLSSFGRKTDARLISSICKADFLAIKGAGPKMWLEFIKARGY